MCPILNFMDHTNALGCTLEGASCFREVSLPCQVAKPGLITFLQSANGGTVMPTAVHYLASTCRVHTLLHLLCSSLMNKNY